MECQLQTVQDICSHQTELQPSAKSYKL